MMLLTGLIERLLTPVKMRIRGLKLFIKQWMSPIQSLIQFDTESYEGGK